MTLARCEPTYAIELLVFRAETGTKTLSSGLNPCVFIRTDMYEAPLNTFDWFELMCTLLVLSARLAIQDCEWWGGKDAARI